MYLLLFNHVEKVDQKTCGAFENLYKHRQSGPQHSSYLSHTPGGISFYADYFFISLCFFHPKWAVISLPLGS